MRLRRLAALCSAFVVLSCGVLCRVYWISTDTAYAASAGGQSVSETALPRERGNFYDRKCRPLTGTLRRWYALCIPAIRATRHCFPMCRLPTRTNFTRGATA